VRRRAELLYQQMDGPLALLLAESRKHQAMKILRHAAGGAARAQWTCLVPNLTYPKSVA